MFETREIYSMCHSICEKKKFLSSRLHSKTQADCGSKRLTNMNTPTLHKYQTSKYLQRKRKLYIRTANVVIVLLFNYCKKIVLVESTEFTVCQAFAPVVRIGSPRPVTCKRVVVPPLDPRGGTHSLREKGRGSQFGRRDRHSGTLRLLHCNIYCIFFFTNRCSSARWVRLCCRAPLKST